MNDIREILIDDASEYKRIRLEALKLNPSAFAENAKDFEKKTLEEIYTEIARWKEMGGFALGAFSLEGNLVGMIGVGRSSYNKLNHRGHVWGVYVTPPARGAGVARALFDRLVERARKNEGLVQLDIEAVTSNQTALKLYQSVGFELCGTQPRALKVGSEYFDEYLLVLKLD